MKLVTSEQIRQIDKAAIEDRGIPGLDLMENAGRGIAQRIQVTIMDQETPSHVSIFCGKGNNGGDGFVVGRYLNEFGAEVAFYFLGPADNMSPDAKENFDRASELGLELTQLSSVDDFPESLDTDYIVDAIFGTGFSGSPRGLSADLIEYLNRQKQPVIAIDLPSGLNADDGRHEGAVVRADHTLTLALPKYGLFVSPGRELAGEVQVVPIGIPHDVVDQFELTTELITAAQVMHDLPDRPPDGHKGTFGKLLIVAGSLGMTGAAALSARSALRCGCGMAKVATPGSVLPTVAGLVMEATGHPLPEVAKKGALALRGLGEIRELARQHEAVALGPGIGRHHETAELIRRLVPSLDRPMVIDADGLNALAGHLSLLDQANNPGGIILTPHPGEFQRLTTEAVPTELEDRIATTQSFALKHGVILVLKGSPTLVGTPDGQVCVNSTGNDGMATGGSGDVLTGVIGSLLAQGMDPARAAIAGVYLHGLAGDLAVLETTRRGLMASDLVDYLPSAFLTLSV